MKILEDIELAPLTTLNVGGSAKYFAEVTTLDELKEVISFAQGKGVQIFVMGGGSNLVVSDSGFTGLVLRPKILGKEIVRRDVDDVWVKAGAGEVLDDVIAWVVEEGLWGMENLSWVPGLVGAFAIQNVGCYGQDCSQVLESITVYDTTDGKIKTLTSSDLKFRYRSSILNKEEKGRYVVIDVLVKLNKFGSPNLSYIDVKKYFAKKGIMSPSLAQIREGIIRIRDKKGQDIKVYKSAGSFFSNLLLTSEEFENLKIKVREVAGDKIANDFEEIGSKFSVSTELDPTGKAGKIKVPTGFLLDIVLNLKGTRVGGAVLSDKQVLNLINEGGAKAMDVMELFRKVRNIAWQKLGVQVINEPELIGFSKKELDHYFSLD